MELRKEEPGLFNDENLAVLREMIMEGVDQEIAWGKYVIGNEIPGLNEKMVEDYIKYLGNQRYSSLGLGTLYEG